MQRLQYLSPSSGEAGAVGTAAGVVGDGAVWVLASPPGPSSEAHSQALLTTVTTAPITTAPFTRRRYTTATPRPITESMAITVATGLMACMTIRLLATTVLAIGAFSSGTTDRYVGRDKRLRSRIVGCTGFRTGAAVPGQGADVFLRLAY